MFDVQRNTLPTDEGQFLDRFKTGQTYTRLKNLLIYQSVPPRTKLDIGILSRRLNVSKTPVREALIMLAEERIIKVEPGRGYYSKPLDAGELAEDYEVAFAMLKHTIQGNVEQFALSGLAGFEMGPKADPLSIVGQTLSHNVRPYAEFIESLYEHIATLARNKLCWQIVHAFNGRTTFVRELDLQQPRRMLEISEAMAEFVRCLERHDAKGAVDSLERQYRRKLDLLHHLVEQGHVHAMNASDGWQDLLH